MRYFSLRQAAYNTISVVNYHALRRLERYRKCDPLASEGPILWNIDEKHLRNRSTIDSPKKYIASTTKQTVGDSLQFCIVLPALR